MPENKIKSKNAQAVIILAGGSGTRMGSEKQYMKLCSKPMIEWTLDAFTGLVDEIILVLSSENIELYGKEIEARGIKIAVAGETRIKSLISGFAKVSAEADIIAVHAGARPLVSREIILACMSEAEKSGASVPAVPLKDTIKKYRQMAKMPLKLFIELTMWLFKRRNVIEGIFLRRLLKKQI